uniref:Probable membrane transporter protein n=1 Tax=Geoglobus ahangari TaxID=113653 RepID=A0A7C4S7S6_9EURY
MEIFDFIIISIAIISSAIVKTAIGVGAGIFLLPVLSLVLPPKQALGLGAPAMLISDIVGLRLYRGEWDKREALLIIPPAVVGVATGVIVVKLLPTTVFKYWVGVFAVTFALYNLAKKIWKLEFPKLRTWKIGRKTALFFGFLGGFASAVSHAGGAVLSLYLLSRKLDKRAFVGLFILFFFLTNLSKTIGYVQIGILTIDLLVAVVVLSPLIALGSIAGNYLNKIVSQDKFRTIVLVVILLTGIRLLY